MINEDFAAHKDALGKYAAIKPEQLAAVAQPSRRTFTDINDQDLHSYPALVDVFYAENVLETCRRTRAHPHVR